LPYQRHSAPISKDGVKTAARAQVVGARRSHRLPRILFYSGFLILLIIAFAPNWSASATQRYVDDSYLIDIALLNQWTTIQRAIDNSTSGDTINVASGVYTEYVVVDKTLTIQGNSRNSTFVTPGYAGNGFTIQANNVNISAITINLTGTGIYIGSPYQKLTVNSVTFEANTYGVYIEGAANVTVVLYEEVYKKKRLVPEESVAQVRPIEFEVSYFSTPYMDNTRLFGGSRFSVIYDGCIDPSVEDQVCRFPLKATAQPRAQFKVITFDEAFLSQRDRPYVDQILEKIGASKGW